MQKAKLDILENIPDIDMVGEIEETEEVSNKALFLDSRQWASNKLIILVLILVLAGLVIAGCVWLYITKIIPLIHKDNIVISDSYNFVKETESDNTSEPIVPSSDKIVTIYFKDFIIDLKDSGGKSKLLFCDVAIDISENENAAQLVNSKDLRKIIYLAAKGKSAVALRSLEERKRLKNEMAKELEKMLGEGIVKNVYFTNYLIM